MGHKLQEARFKKSTMSSVSEIMRVETPIARGYATRLLSPFEASGYTKIDQGRAELAHQVLTDTNAPNTELNATEENAITFGMSCLMHTDPDVRKEGIAIIKHMHE